MAKLGAILYGVVGFIAFLFVLVGTPIDQFRERSQNIAGNTPCLTLWGKKEKCYSLKYDIRPADLFRGCDKLVDRFRAAEAFAIISIGVMLVAVILGLVTCCCCGCLRWVACGLMGLSIVTVCIVWALMANAYNADVGGCLYTPLKRSVKYGAGFALTVTGWCLIFVSLILLNVL
ncbi:Amastin surface glycoprotein [Trypanosoma melophagium]|uniref:Amastin surface glycoprotein n=1 Tax=Trypanosoma melophagium TaxID=715481 RepID=UPI00351A3D68|nr:Amastin surface glycoprotein [Trypanosoma melophagium]